MGKGASSSVFSFEEEEEKKRGGLTKVTKEVTQMAGPAPSHLSALPPTLPTPPALPTPLVPPLTTPAEVSAAAAEADFDIHDAQKMAHAIRESEIEKRVVAMKNECTEKIKYAIQGNMMECVYEVPMVAIEHDHPFYAYAKPTLARLVTFLQDTMGYIVSQAAACGRLTRLTISWNRADLQSWSIAQLRAYIQDQNPDDQAIGFCVYHAILFQKNVIASSNRYSIEKQVAACTQRIRACVLGKIPSCECELVFHAESRQPVPSESERLLVFGAVVGELQRKGFTITDQMASRLKFRVSGWLQETTAPPAAVPPPPAAAPMAVSVPVSPVGVDPLDLRVYTESIIRHTQLRCAMPSSAEIEAEIEQLEAAIPALLKRMSIHS